MPLTARSEHKPQCTLDGLAAVRANRIWSSRADDFLDGIDNKNHWTPKSADEAAAIRLVFLRFPQPG